MKLRSDTLFQCTAVGACAIVGLPTLVELWFASHQLLRDRGITGIRATAGVLVASGIVVAVLATFAAMLWWTTRRIPSPRLSTSRLVLLGAQAAFGFFYSTDFFYIVAAEVPFVLPRRPALIWVSAQGAASLVLGFLVHAGIYGHFDPLPDVPHVPGTIVFGLTMLQLLGWQAFAFCVGYIAATERTGREELARVNGELVATQELLADGTRLAERLRISRELHDTLGHHLAALSVNLELAGRLASGRSLEPIREAHGLTRRLLREVRDVVSALQDDRQLDLRHALETMIAGVSSPQVHFAAPAELHVNDASQAHVVFRCVQEALTNAIKHAKARNLWITVAQSPGGVEVHVRDDGAGRATVTFGSGLTGMHDRIREVGGRLEVESSDSGGFGLRAWLPVRESQL